MKELPTVLYYAVRVTDEHIQTTAYYRDATHEALTTVPDGFVINTHEPYYMMDKPPRCLHALGQGLVNALFKENLFLKEQVEAREVLLDAAGMGGVNQDLVSILRQFLRYSFKPVRAEFSGLTGEEQRIFGHPELFQQFLDWAGYTKL